MCGGFGIEENVPKKYKKLKENLHVSVVKSLSDMWVISEKFGELEDVDNTEDTSEKLLFELLASMLSQMQDQKVPSKIEFRS